MNVLGDIKIPHEVFVQTHVNVLTPMVDTFVVDKEIVQMELLVLIMMIVKIQQLRHNVVQNVV